MFDADKTGQSLTLNLQQTRYHFITAIQLPLYSPLMIYNRR